MEQSIETICTDFNPKLAMILLQTKPDLMERWARYDEKENTTYFHFKALPVISEVIHTFEEPDPFFVSVQNIIDGLRVPEDISICGFTNGNRSIACDPMLTTVEQRGVRVGEEAANILIGHVEGTIPLDHAEKRIVRTRLILRGTTR